ncbi:M48 family metalloprotease [Calothrix sp. FACHB-1219]|uniref:zinc metalloprotease HtpX n=1 Tax=unclassified Calothrix TaxID=2619626 RepID=UPI001686D946|nr:MULTISPECIES: zinc metalloprotease HtpX [unclassified Calothrix]MBD2207638.1 M48 family metalloprotease [Calothrix sp. FACHB-168]MBD2222279.1 M48 family metalloprotease [Calothrix sp. FACHB-1219]
MPSHAELSLEAGLVALKQGNYQTAIAQLEPVASSQKNTTAGLQAQVGLVMAYARMGQVSKAIALCQNLLDSPNPQVQEWAERALGHLKKRQKRQNTAKNSANGHVTADSTHSNGTNASQQTITKTNSSAVPAGSLRNSHVETIGVNGLVASGYRTAAKSFQIYWRHAPRAKVWQPLHKLNLLPLKLLAAGTFMALFWVIREMLQLTMTLTNQIFIKLAHLRPLPLFNRNPTVLVLVVLAIAIALSPWLLDWLLGKFYQQRELSKEVLNGHSRETIRVLQRACQQRRWQFPKLRILPINAPIAFTYGNLARNARIVVSQGLLEQLADDEIAVIYATQLGQIIQKDYLVMSLILLVTLPVYRLYQLFSEWGNKFSGFGRWPGIILASFTYGIWCLLTGPALWLSKLRVYYSDRTAAEITGNPNALIRALLKITIGVAGDIGKQEHTSWQLESLNLLAPVSYQQSISMGSLAGHIPFTSLLMWDNFNPYRRWFTFNNSHPLIGDRIQRLCKIARHWHLETELHLVNEQALRGNHQPFLLQIAPWLGIPLGLLFAGLIWLVWQIAYAMKILNLKWIYEDWSFVTGCLLIGFSIGMILRMNSLFPDIRPANLQTDDRLPNLLANPSAIPIDSINVCLAGRLIGRPGVGNSLGQDLMLQSHIGLVKLHHIPWLGQSINPQDLIGRQITIVGWFRRGATPWIDIQTIQTQNGQIINSAHPIWSTILAVAAQAWGAFIFLKG